MEDIKLTPYAPNLVESTRSIGYSFETALADIIDNSISNDASKIEVKFDTNNEPYVAIIDDGIGMDKDTLEAAMRYGSSNVLDERDSKDLGRFGLGLKMASMSQCRKLTVLSKKEKEIFAVCWDLDYIYETQDWLLIRYSDVEKRKIRLYDELEKMNNGTIVLWENFDKISESEFDFEKEFNEKVSFADRHLSLVFHRYLEKNKFELFFNGRKLEPINPYVLSNKATQVLEEETLFINDEKIKIIPYITPYISKLSAEERHEIDKNKDLNLKQGLYIYRNKRLIVWGKWFRLLKENELKKLTKIQIDLPNNIDDYWTIDVKKSSAQIPSVIKENLKQIVYRSSGKSEKVYRYRGRKESTDIHDHIWNKVENRNKIQYLINKDIPMYKVVEKSLDETQLKLFESFIKAIEDSFPYAIVYCELAKEKEYDEKTLETEEVYNMAKMTLETCKNKEDRIDYLKTFKKIDIFLKYPEVIELLEEEILYE